MANGILKNKGKEWIIDKLLEDTQNKALWIGWGTGAGEHTEENNSLFGEVGARVQAVMTKVAANQLKWEATLINNTAAPITITNAGNFTSEVNGDLITAKSGLNNLIEVGEGILFTITMTVSGV